MPTSKERDAAARWQEAAYCVAAGRNVEETPTKMTGSPGHRLRTRPNDPKQQENKKRRKPETGIAICLSLRLSFFLPFLFFVRLSAFSLYTTRFIFLWPLYSLHTCRGTGFKSATMGLTDGWMEGAVCKCWLGHGLLVALIEALFLSS